MRTRYVVRNLLVALGMLLASGCPAGEPAVTGWRHDGSGIYPDAQPPTTWSDKENILWSADVGDSFSSPVVSNDRVFVTAEPDILFCLDAATGKELWRRDHEIKNLPPELANKVLKLALGSGNAAPTPVTDGTHVYVQFASTVVACYDFQGTRIWVKAFGLQPVSQDGRSASPVLAGGKLLLQMGYLSALDAHTGDLLWKTENVVETFGTLAVTRIGGEDVAFTPAGSVVNLKDGKLLAQGIAGLNYASPLIQGQTIFFLDSVANAVKLPEKPEPFEPATLWTQPLEGQFYASSIVHDGLVHAVTDAAKYRVLDAHTGDILLEKDLPIPPNGGENAVVFSSLSLAGGFLFISNDHGDTVVLEPGKTFKQIARNHLGSGSASTPAFAGKCIYLRSGRKLYCIAEKK